MIVRYFHKDGVKALAMQGADFKQYRVMRNFVLEGRCFDHCSFACVVGVSYHYTRKINLRHCHLRYVNLQG